MRLSWTLLLVACTGMLDDPITITWTIDYPMALVAELVITDG